MELCNIGKEISISKSLYDNIKQFQESPKEYQDWWCSYCGCEGGCCLCHDISNAIIK